MRIPHVPPTRLPTRRLVFPQVLGPNLWACPTLTAHRIRDFGVNLVSANNSCVTACLDLLVRSFVPPQGPKVADPDVQQTYATRKVSALRNTPAPTARVGSAAVGHACVRRDVVRATGFAA